MNWHNFALNHLVLMLLFSKGLIAQEWLSIVPASTAAPTPRTNATAIYDSQNHRMVVFGGCGDSGDVSDVWALDLNSDVWSDLTPTTGNSPSPRRTPNGIYDSDSHSMIMWSGQTGGTTLNDVWAFDLNTTSWTELTPMDPKPNTRYGTVSILDQADKNLVTFAGFTSRGRFNDSWRFSLANDSWTEVTPGGNLPQRRCLHSASFDTLNRRMIVYGGQSAGALGDIWAFDLAQHTWSELTPAQSPPGRWFPTNVYDTENHRVMIFGGNLGSGKANEVWAFDLADNEWQQLSTSGTPPTARDGATAIYLASEARMLVFAGRDGNGTYLNDIWSLDLSQPVSVEPLPENDLPASFQLFGNYPNPFNPRTNIVFELSEPGPVTLNIYNVRGRLVIKLLMTAPGPGRHEIGWNGTDESGRVVDSGVYIYRIGGPNFSARGKMILLK